MSSLFSSSWHMSRLSLSSWRMSRLRNVPLWVWVFLFCLLFSVRLLHVGVQNALKAGVVGYRHKLHRCSERSLNPPISMKCHVGFYAAL